MFSTIKIFLILSKVIKLNYKFVIIPILAITTCRQSHELMDFNTSTKHNKFIHQRLLSSGSTEASCGDNRRFPNLLQDTKCYYKSLHLIELGVLGFRFVVFLLDLLSAGNDLQEYSTPQKFVNHYKFFFISRHKSLNVTTLQHHINLTPQRRIQSPTI